MWWSREQKQKVTAVMKEVLHLVALGVVAKFPSLGTEGARNGHKSFLDRSSLQNLSLLPTVGLPTNPELYFSSLMENTNIYFSGLL